LDDLDGETVWRDVLHFNPKRLSKSQTRTTGKREEKLIFLFRRTGNNPGG
jgi:hypothetical protein